MIPQSNISLLSNRLGSEAKNYREQLIHIRFKKNL